MPKILIIEDDLAFGLMIQKWLMRKGFDTEKATSLRAARQLLAHASFDIILSDLRLPDGDGIGLLTLLRGQGDDTPFIVMTSYAEVQNAVLAMKSGATDYIAKPFPPDLLLEKLQDALKPTATSNSGKAPSAPTKDDNLQSSTSESPDIPRYIEGESDASKQLYRYVDLVAPTPMSVLILGASGTGKEYVARRIHEKSTRHDKPFFALDCGAIPREVAASEFFGYRKGAFTGAEQDKKGAFETANGGTLFLDEIGNLPYDIQVVREGHFREDLYHRVNEFTISMPELKDRGDDIFRFADLFLQRANAALDRHVEGFSQEARRQMAAYSWPGNLRELNNVIKRATLLAKDNIISGEDLGLAMMPEPHAMFTTALHDEATEQQRIAEALRAAKGNKSKAARLLEVDRKTLYNKLRKYGMED